MYASDNGGRFPTAVNWDAAIYPYVRNEWVYVCTSDQAPRRSDYYPHQQSYALNAVAGGGKSSDLTLPVLFDGAKLYGGAEAGVFRHSGGLHVGFADGHAKWVSRETFTGAFLRPPGVVSGEGAGAAPPPPAGAH